MEGCGFAKWKDGRVTMENGKAIRWTAKEFSVGKTAISILETMKTIRKAALEFLFGLMGKSMKDFRVMGNSMAWVFLAVRVLLFMVFGKMEF